MGVKTQTDLNATIEADFSTIFSPIADNLDKEKKERKEKDQQQKPKLNDTIAQMDLTGIYKMFLPHTEEYHSSQCRESPRIFSLK